MEMTKWSENSAKSSKNKDSININENNNYNFLLKTWFDWYYPILTKIEDINIKMKEIEQDMERMRYD